MEAMMGRHLLIGILIALLSGGGCARPGLTVRSERGISPADLQRVRQVEYAEEDLKEAVAPYAGHLAWVARQQESRLRLRLASDWATPADPAQRALVDAYLGWCAGRGGAGDCLEVIWFTGYLATLLLPEVVTKVLFVLMTTNLIAFLGFDGFHNILEGYRVMRDEAAAAQTFEKLQEAGERYGRRMGPSVVRIVTALVTWGLSSATGMARPVSGLPGAAQAAANARAQGFELAAVNGGSATVSATGAVTLVLAAQATMPEISGPAEANVQEPIGRKLSRNERLTQQKNERIDEYLRNRGRKVEPNPLEGTNGAGRQGDRIVDGVKTEYKTLEPGATSSTVRNVVNASIRRGGQARQIVIDARGSGLTEPAAREGVARAAGIVRGLVDKLEVIGDGFYFVHP
jgi:hypothetical protein